MSADLKLTYPDLPVSREREQILAALAKNSVIVVVGDTGSGKTTQLPKMAMEADQARQASGKIGCTQPRRIAAAGVAGRVAEELGTELGSVVGYQVRFDDRSSGDTAIKFMTDGILLAETQGDPELRQYSTLIIDEAHERSLNIDFLLGYLKQLLEKRKDLKLIISSATLDAGSFASFFNEAPVIQVEGRTFPVEEHYLPEEEGEELPEHVGRAVRWLSQVDHEGDVLVFLPGEREIREVHDVLDAMRFPTTDVLPLFARLGLSEQQQVFNPTPGRRRIVLATNVAETSLTIPGIVYVIDSGVARVSRWIPGRGVQRLQIEPISQASAKQRKGRCGRISEGVCIRLYDEEDFDLRAEFTDPEIRRSSLAGVILRMKSLGLSEIYEFPFINPPSKTHISEGFRTLQDIGALNKGRELTRLGRKLSKLPLDPAHARMLIEAESRGCLREMLVIVAGLSVMDPRERPSEKRKEADEAHKRWLDRDSDFTTYLKMWADLSEFRDGRGWKRNQLRKHCKKHFLNFKRVFEWDNLHRDILRFAKRALKWSPDSLPSDPRGWAETGLIHKCILAGIPRSFGVWDHKDRSYKGPQGKAFAIFPGSGLFNRKKRLDWVLATELVDTTRLWARKVAMMQPEWLEEVAPHLCKSHYYDAVFDPQQGAVYGKERVVCGGFIIIKDRPVHYGRIFPEQAREIFIREALLGEGLKSRPAFLRHLDEMREQVKLMEVKLRKPNQLWCEEGAFEFFDDRLPADVHTAKAFHQWRKALEGKDKMALHLTADDVLYQPVDELPLEHFPDEITYADQSYPLYYHHGPGDRDDGVTIGVHIDQLPDFPDLLPDWGVAGQLELRADALIRSLPKDLRKCFHPIQAAANDFADFWRRRQADKPITFEMAEFLSQWGGRAVDPSSFSLDRLAHELVMKIWVCDDAGEELGFGESVAELREKLAPQLSQRFESQAGSEWEMSGHTEWDFGELPEEVEIGPQVGYPALIDENETVGLRVYPQAWEAQRSHRQGCIRLAMLSETDHVDYVKKGFPMSTEAKLYLPMLGRDSSSHFSDLMELAVEGAMGMPLPRSAEAFELSSKRMREHLYETAERLGDFVEQVALQFRVLAERCDAERDHRYHGPIVEDIEAQIDWLFRPRFLAKCGFAQFLEYPRYFEAMIVRLDRLKSLPYLRDVEKFNQLKPYHEDWLNASTAQGDSGPTDQLGWMLQEWRVSLFAPTLPVPIKVSEKRIAQLADSLFE